jgi:hypothetical protein
VKKIFLKNSKDRATFELDPAPLHGYSALMLALRMTRPTRSYMLRT